jgi:LysM repeat protein
MRRILLVARRLQRMKLLLGPGVLLVLPLWLSGCGGQFETLASRAGTVFAPPAQTVAAQGGQIAGTQAARLLQTAQVRVATESALLKETAKVQAATAAGSLIDTAQAKLVTESAGQVTAGPTELANLKNTAEALVATQVFERLPFIQTQAAGVASTALIPLGTESTNLQATVLPPEAVQAAGEMQATLQSLAATELYPLSATPVPPTVPADPVGPTIIVYIVNSGDSLSSISRVFGISIEQLVFYNQLRYPWLAKPSADLVPGMTLVVGRQPDTGSPISPSGQVPWSGIAGCDVSRVDWLLPPINCQTASIDVVEKFDLSLGCISLNNPLGNTARHRAIKGWILTGADGTRSYGWYVDRGRGAVIVGPALISSSRQYVECQNK